MAVLATAAAVALRLLVLQPTMGTKASFPLLTMAIMVGAWCGGLGPGLLSTALGAIAWIFLWPHFFESVHLGDANGYLQLIGFFVVGVWISVLCEQMHRSRRRVETGAAAIHRASRALMEYGEFKDAARQIFDACKELIGATAGFVALRGEGGDIHEDQFADPGELLCAVDRDQRSPLRGLRAEVYRTGQSIYVNDFPNSPWAAGLPDGHMPMDSVLFVPMVIHGHTLGMLGLANKRGGFTDKDLHTAELFAELGVVALNRGRMVQSLENSERRFRAVAQTATDAIITLDSRGSVVFWNRGAEALFGYAAEEMSGKPLTLIMPERHRAAHARGLDARVSGNAGAMVGKTVEMTALRKNGQEFPVELSLAQWQTAEGVFFTGIARDMTERMRARKEREERAAHLDALIRVTEQSLAQRTVEGILRRAAAGARELTKARLAVSAYGFQDGVFRIIAASKADDGVVLPDGEAAKINKGGVYLDLIEGHSTIRLDDQQLRNHPRWRGLPPEHPPLRGLLGARLIGHNSRPGGLIMVSDKTTGDFTPEDEALLGQLAAMTSLGLQQIEARAQAEAASAAKDRFLAVLSHEMRTPLTPVLLATTTLEHIPDLSPDVRDEIATIRRNVQMEARLIDDLLDLTRIAHGKVELRISTLDAHTKLQGAMEICRSEIQTKGLTISTNLDAAVHHIKGDPGRLQQIFWNLIKNACKFTPSGGRIELRSSNPRDGILRIDVADTGIGIEPEYLPRIFTAFEQGDPNTTRRFGGLGLGLAICRALVELHGGTIYAQSNGAATGSCFTVELPTVPAPAEADRKAPRAAPLPRSPLRILLVEDHPDTLRIMARLLQSLDYEVRTASDVRTALEAAKATTFDLVLSDLGLPDGSGLDLMRQLKADYGLRGIALSGFGTEDDIRLSREAGFLYHLTKPTNFEVIQEVIARVMEQAD